MEPEDGYDTDEPSDGEDSQKSNLLTHGDLQGPDDSNGKEGHEKIGYNVDTGVHIPNPMTRSALHVVGLNSWYHPRFIVDALRSRLLKDLPVSVNRDACEDRSDDRRYAPKDANGHNDVERDAHLSHSEDPSVLEKNRHFGEHEAGVVANDTPEQVLGYISLII